MKFSFADTRRIVLASLRLALCCLVLIGFELDSLAQSTPITINDNAQARKVSEQDLKFGETQMTQFFADRPVLSELISKHDAIWDWAVRQFAGESSTDRISWNPAEMPDKSREYTADHRYPIPGGRAGWIRVRKFDQFDRLLSAENVLSSFVFECYNLRNGPKFYALHKSAMAGELTKEKYIDANVRLEYEAVLRLKNFYRNYFVPFAAGQQLTTHRYEWKENEPDTYEEWIALYKNPKGYPWNSWGRYYDKIVTPYLLKKEQQTQEMNRMQYQDGDQKYEIQELQKEILKTSG